jgi:16S rRNA (guanine527-N7)-methyltransferase
VSGPARRRGQGARTPARRSHKPDVATTSTSHPDALAEDRARALQLVPVSRETLSLLDCVVALLVEWQRTTNLIAPSTIPKLWTRHVADSLQLVALAPAAKVWIDLGAGAGFPGLVIACALAGKANARVHLVESNAKKAAFLREAVRVSGAAALVHATRITNFVANFAEAADVVTARALAPLPDLLKAASPLLKKGAVGLFPKGQDVEGELTAAAKCWKIQMTLVASVTDSRGRIVVVRGLEKRDQSTL